MREIVDARSEHECTYEKNAIGVVKKCIRSMRVWGFLICVRAWPEDNLAVKFQSHLNDAKCIVQLCRRRLHCTVERALRPGRWLFRISPIDHGFCGSVRAVRGSRGSVRAAVRFRRFGWSAVRFGSVQAVRLECGGSSCQSRYCSLDTCTVM